MQCGLDMVLGEVPKISRTADTFLLVLEHSRALWWIRSVLVLALSLASDVVNLEDHLDYLCSQQDLLLLANQGLNHMLLLHVCAGGNKKQTFSLI